jgi:hypothetical protein
MKLRLKGWARRLARNVQTVRGAILTAIFGVMLLFWLSSVIFSAAMAGATSTSTTSAEYVERFAPLALLIYCISMIATSGTTAPFVFSPAEVQFLFSGPFTRRQLLAYKILVQFLLTLPIALFMSIAMRTIAGSLLSGLAAVLLTLVFMQMFGLTINLVACAVGEMFYSRARRIVLWSFLAVIVIAALMALRASGFNGGVLEIVKEIDQTELFQYTTAPLKWYVKVLTSRQLDAAFFRYAAQCLALDLGLLALIFALDARFTEQAAANSERRYARLQRLRSGGLAGMSTPRSGKPRFFLAPLPYLGGAGPIAWRQMLAAVRSQRLLGILLFATLMSCIGPIIAMMSEPGPAGQALPYTLASMTLVMSMLLNQALAFDFRADVDRIEVLKSLPIPAWRIVIGQLITPVVYASLYQIGLIAMLQLLVGELELVLGFTVALAMPVNLLLVGVENWLFLLFPARMGPAHPGDFSHAGRQMLLMLGKGISLMIGIGIPAIFAAVAYYLSGHNWFVAIVVAMVPATIISVLPIPLVTLAFKNFDVSRDTPP